MALKGLCIVCLGLDICHRAFVMVGFQRGIENP